MKKVLSILILFIFVIIVATRIATPYAIKTMVPQIVAKYTGFDSSIESVDLNIIKGHIAIKGIFLKNPKLTQGSKLEAITIDLSIKHLLDKKIIIESVKVSGLNTFIHYSPEEQIYAGYFAKESQADSGEPSAAETTNSDDNRPPSENSLPLAINLKSFSLTDTSIHLKTETQLTEVFIKRLGVTNLELNNNKTTTNATVELTIDEMPITANAKLKPFSLSETQWLDIKLNQININRVMAILEDFGVKKNISGTLASEIHIEFNESMDRWQAQIHSTGAIDDLQYSTNDQKLTTQALEWKVHIQQGPSLATPLVNLDSKINNINFTKESDQEIAGITAEAFATENLKIDWNKKTIHLGHLNLTNLQPQISTKAKPDQKITKPSQSTITIKDLKFSMFENRFDLSTSIGNNGYITFSQTPEQKIKMDMKSVNLVDFNSLLANQIGYEIDQGQLNLKLDAVSNSKKDLKGKINIELSNMKLDDKNQLGQKFDSRMPVPLDVTLPALSNSDNLIQLEFELDGNLDDPQLSPLVFVSKTLSLLILKEVGKKAGTELITMYLPLLASTVMSPAMAYTLIDKGYDFVTKLRFEPLQFEPGTTQLTDASLKQIHNVAETLKKIPNAVLNFCPIANPQEIYKPESKVKKIPEIDSLTSLYEPILKLARERLDIVERDLTETYKVPPKQVITCKPKIDDGQMATLEIKAM